MLHFEWDSKKDYENKIKYGVSFRLAQYAFSDSYRVIAQDLDHSHQESRFYCFGKVAKGILTVRFTYRKDIIRIIGAGYWRKGRRVYETQNKVR